MSGRVIAFALMMICAARAEGEAAGERLAAFTLRESAEQIQKRFGVPANVKRGPGFAVLCFQDNAQAEHEDGFYDWCFYFEIPTGALLSVTRNLEPARALDALFPETSSRTHAMPHAPGGFGATSRKLNGDRVLVAVGRRSRGDRCGQLVLMRAGALPRFYPWIAP